MRHWRGALRDGFVGHMPPPAAVAVGFDSLSCSDSCSPHRSGPMNVAAGLEFLAGRGTCLSLFAGLSSSSRGRPLLAYAPPSWLGASWMIDQASHLLLILISLHLRT